MTDMLAFFINPGFLLMLAGAICALVPISNVRKLIVLGAPILAGMMIFHGVHDPSSMNHVWHIFGLDLNLMNIDRMSMLWGYVFCLAAVLNGIYGLHENSRITDSASLIYTGAALAGVFVGDLISLFVFWELAAISSVFLVWMGGPNAFGAGLRYLTFHVLSGVMLLAGAVMYGASRGGDYSFGHIGLDAPGGWLLILAMGIKAGFPFLHCWIKDAYPKSSVTGTVILSAFTTKLAIYALARGFAGTELLIYVGAVMTVFPVFFAVIENDLRKVLSYSLNNQLGFMVCGIGLGTELAMNGVAAHVAADVVFKGLLFMSMGAVLLRTGTAKASDLGGLFRSMPFTTIFCLIGAGSIAAFPLLSAFVTKSLIMTAALEEHKWLALAMLLFASAGVMEHSGIKVPFFAFFAHDSGKRVEEAPINMLVAMGLAALLCIVFAFPWGGYQFLYSLLPYELDYNPYTGNHVVTQLQLLFAAMFAFALLRRMHLYPEERRAEILDFDWVYRRLGVNIARWIDTMWTRLSINMRRLRHYVAHNIATRLYYIFSPAGALSASAPSGLAAVLTLGMLVVCIGIVYVSRL